MTQRAAVTEAEILTIAGNAARRRVRRLADRCLKAAEEWGEAYVREWVPQCRGIIEKAVRGEEITPSDGMAGVFTKADFIVEARKYLRRHGRRVKVETLFRKLRKLAEYREGIEYVDKRKGIYRLLKQGDEIEDDAGVL